jgi:hypothetical protein
VAGVGAVGAVERHVAGEVAIGVLKMNEQYNVT